MGDRRIGDKRVGWGNSRSAGSLLLWASGDGGCDIAPQA